MIQMSKNEIRKYDTVEFERVYGSPEDPSTSTVYVSDNPEALQTLLIGKMGFVSPYQSRETTISDGMEMYRDNSVPGISQMALDSIEEYGGEEVCGFLEVFTIFIKWDL